MTVSVGTNGDYALFKAADQATVESDFPQTVTVPNVGIL